MPTLDVMRLVWDYILARLDIDPSDEDGLTTTEWAVLTFLAVGAAIVVGKIIFDAAKGNADNIPKPQAPTGGP